MIGLEGDSVCRDELIEDWRGAAYFYLSYHVVIGIWTWLCGLEDGAGLADGASVKAEFVVCLWEGVLMASAY